MKANRLTILVLALAAPARTLACTPVLPTESMFQDAAIVLIGKAVSSRWVPGARDNLLVSVKTIETLRGTVTDTLEAASPCALPIDDGERVVVVSGVERLFVYPADMYESAARAGVRGGR